MTPRIMGDATHANVPALTKVKGLQLAAGYDTGSPDIKWVAADWALFPHVPNIHIDQGGTGSPVYTAHVMDIEPGAYSPAQATTWINNCTQPRPTPYCARNDFTAVVTAALQSPKWKGDLWLAYPGWQPGQPLPEWPGVHIVAVQNDYTHTAYDLSAVLDPYWPLEAPVELPVKKLPAPPVTIEANTATLDVTGRNGGRYVMVWDQATDKWREVAWPVS